MASLEIDRVSKKFGSHEVLREVSLSIEPGEFLVLLGPSGCGKSTLLNMIAGLEAVTNGELRIAGRRVNEQPAKDRDIAMVFQSYALYPTMNVRQNIEFGMKIRGVKKPDRLQAVNQVASLLQIEGLLERRPSQLSGGQRQRVAMGRALVRNPKLFLFDEPLSNLDAKLRVDMRTEIKRLHKRLGTTIVYVTHDQIEAMTMATKVAVMRDGTVQQFAEPDAVYETPANVYVARFVGSPAMNIVPGVLTDTGNAADVTLAPSAIVRDIPLSQTSRRAYNGRRVLAGIRPEIFQVAVNGGGSIDAVVDVVEPTGPDMLAFFSIADTEIIARLPPRSVAMGEHLSLAVVPEKTVLFDFETEQRIV